MSVREELEDDLARARETLGSYEVRAKEVANTVSLWRKRIADIETAISALRYAEAMSPSPDGLMPVEEASSPTQGGPPVPGAGEESRDQSDTVFQQQAEQALAAPDPEDVPSPPKRHPFISDPTSTAELPKISRADLPFGAETVRSEDGRCLFVQVNGFTHIVTDDPGHPADYWMKERADA